MSLHAATPHTELILHSYLNNYISWPNHNLPITISFFLQCRSELLFYIIIQVVMIHVNHLVQPTTPPTRIAQLSNCGCCLHRQASLLSISSSRLTTSAALGRSLGSCFQQSLIRSLKAGSTSNDACWSSPVACLPSSRWLACHRLGDGGTSLILVVDLEASSFMNGRRPDVTCSSCAHEVQEDRYGSTAVGVCTHNTPQGSKLVLISLSCGRQ